MSGTAEYRSAHALEGAMVGAAFTCLLLLLAADAAFVLLHVVHKQGQYFTDSLFHLGKDGGFAEMFQYLKTGCVVFMLAGVWSRTREDVYAAWMLLFGYALADDALRIHERGGGVLASLWAFGDVFGLGAQDFGELAVSATFGLAFLLVLTTTYRRASRPAKSTSQQLALLFAVLVFFGVVVDMLHVAAPDGAMKDALGIAEDGGELVAMSVIAWYVLKLRLR